MEVKSEQLTYYKQVKSKQLKFCKDKTYSQKLDTVWTIEILKHLALKSGLFLHDQHS